MKNKLPKSKNVWLQRNSSSRPCPFPTRLTCAIGIFSRFDQPGIVFSIGRDGTDAATKERASERGVVLREKKA